MFSAEVKVGHATWMQRAVSRFFTLITDLVGDDRLSAICLDVVVSRGEGEWLEVRDCSVMYACSDDVGQYAIDTMSSMWGAFYSSEQLESTCLWYGGVAVVAM